MTTRVNIKNIVIALAIGLVMASCGSRGSNQSGTATTETKTQTASAGTTLEDLNDNNWKAVVKANFGLDLTVPAGWSFNRIIMLGEVFFCCLPTTFRRCRPSLITAPATARSHY